jgi:hypothetical protein
LLDFIKSGKRSARKLNRARIFLLVARHRLFMGRLRIVDLGQPPSLSISGMRPTMSGPAQSQAKVVSAPSTS